MTPLIFSLPTLAVSAFYCIWRRISGAQQRLERIICDRVTFMLWVIANERRSTRRRR
jgi:hypothetical protein